LSPRADLATLEDAGRQLWQDADLASALLAIDPDGLKGVSLNAAAGPVRDGWWAHFRDRVNQIGPIVQMPAGSPEDRVLGGLDLAGTLAAGRPVMEAGLLHQADQGMLVVRMAERLPRSTAAHLGAALDTGEVRIERQGLSGCVASRFGLILFDESCEEMVHPPQLLLERMAFHIPLDGVSIRQAALPVISRDLIGRAREALPMLHVPDDMARAIDAAALQLGVTSLRVLQFCLRATRALAALDGGADVEAKHAELACRLILSPRMTLPPELAPEEVAPPPVEEGGESPQSQSREETRELEERLVEAAKLSYALRLGARPSGRRQRGLASGLSGGRSGDLRESRDRGRPVGVRLGDPRRDGRLDLLATLRAAAPWQGLRGRRDKAGQLSLRSEDFRLRRTRIHIPSVVIFVVDASGSLAMSRMAEAKGAVELLLSDCYTRRDQVALIAFRKETAELLLPPTRSLVRVRRSLARLPGGGGTPLAAGAAAALRLALSERSRGRSPYLVFLSDGKANISLEGQPGRDRADEDATMMARQIRSAGVPSLFLDMSRRSSPQAMAIAMELGATYQLLPYADSSAVSSMVGQFLRG
jgi:magnesium chelatase subunit D